MANLDVWIEDYRQSGYNAQNAVARVCQDIIRGSKYVP